MKLISGAVSIFFLLIALASQPAFSQTSASEPGISPNFSRSQSPISATANLGVRRPRFYGNLYEGVKTSFSWWNLTGIAAGAFLDRQKPAQGLKLAPFQVDHEISETFAKNDGKKSLGALSPLYYPGVTATARMAGMMLFDAVGIHDYSAATYAKMFRFQQALYYTNVVTHLAKGNIQRYRPDGSDTYSFFSGHTSAAFATSTFLYLEARDFIDGLAQSRDGRLPLLSPAGWKMLSFSTLYGWAGYVGYSRIHDKKHYLSDVLVGAASGTLVSYLVYPHQARSEKFQMGIQPVRNGAALEVGIKF